MDPQPQGAFQLAGYSIEELLKQIKEHIPDLPLRSSDFDVPSEEVFIRYFNAVVSEFGIDISKIKNPPELETLEYSETYESILAIVKLLFAVKELFPAKVNFMSDCGLNTFIEPSADDVKYIAAMSNFHVFTQNRLEAFSKRPNLLKLREDMEAINQLTKENEELDELMEQFSDGCSIEQMKAEESEMLEELSRYTSLAESNSRVYHDLKLKYESILSKQAELDSENLKLKGVHEKLLKKVVNVDNLLVEKERLIALQQQLQQETRDDGNCREVCSDSIKKTQITGILDKIGKSVNTLQDLQKEIRSTRQETRLLKETVEEKQAALTRNVAESVFKERRMKMEEDELNALESRITHEIHPLQKELLSHQLEKEKKLNACESAKGEFQKLCDELEKEKERLMEIENTKLAVTKKFEEERESILHQMNVANETWERDMTEILTNPEELD